MDENVLKAALAGLLHDIGKFAQRTGDRPSRLWDTEAEREYKYEHAVFSGDFVEQYLPEALKPLSPPAYHHAPKSEFDRLIQLADRLSAGERDSDVERARQPKSLQAILSHVQLFKPDGQAVESLPLAFYWPLKPLALDDKVIFPAPDGERENGDQAYGALWQAFLREADDLKRTYAGIDTYLENLLNLLQHYAWCVPAAYYKCVPDISLYDHSRMTAALAACLSSHSSEQIHDWLKDEAQDQPVAMLVGGDLSGVQDFIYTISSKKAAKTLRGRSFYLQLLTEAVLRFVLRELGLPYTNVIYSGGGHFYLIASIKLRDQLADVQRRITEILLVHHRTALYLALGCAPVPAGGFRVGEFYKHWNDMHHDLSRAKQQRYRELGLAMHEKVFKPEAHGGNREQTCAVCGEESLHATALGEPDDPQGKICPLCKSFEEIGTELSKSEFVALGLSQPSELSGEIGKTAYDVLGAFGMSVQFAANPHQTIAFDSPIQQVVMWSFKDAQSWPIVKSAPVVHSVRYTVNQVPEMDFSDLQEKATGISRLGVLRMDVDNLGDLFKDGFGWRKNSRATLSRLAALSFSLSLFFEGWVKALCESPEYDNLIYAVYAGGDDVFLIGPWDKMPGLANRIARDLDRFSGHNANIHASGELSFIHGKYPVYQAAEDAHKALEQAKHTNGKAALSFLGQTWKWDTFSRMTDEFNRLVKIASKKKDGGLSGPQSILQVLRKLARDRASDKRGRTIWGPWAWQSVYHLTRRAEQAGKESPLGQELIAIRESLKNNDYQDLDQWGAAARWAQLFLREGDDNR